MSDLVLKIENLSKQYRLGLVGTGTLSHDLNRFWYLIRGKEDPYIKVGEVNDREESGGQYVWALNNINIEVFQGEVLGIIGKNGAGKSTLLKILSQVTMPTEGVVKAKGRIASLLEVGTGFHPELTGLENIYLNGAILGMTKAEIKVKLEEIIAFSGVQKYIDTPTKRYSSGMIVRLRFAIAAHLEPEILIVDEVLAVGDAEFQKKCLGKMKEVSSEGRTVLFVSHNMAAIKSLCTKAILLRNGQLHFEGNVDDVVHEYMNFRNDKLNHLTFSDPLTDNENFNLYEIGVKSSTKDKDSIFDLSDEINIYLKIEILNNVLARNFHINFRIKDEEGNYLFVASSSSSGNNLNKGINCIKMVIPANFFNVGVFFVDFMLIKDRKASVFIENDIISFTLINKVQDLGKWMGKTKGPLKPQFNWIQDV